MLQAMPNLRATTLLEELQRHHPGDFPDRLLSSLQRRVAHWRATEGPERELVFRQEHSPGLQALSDFTDGVPRRIIPIDFRQPTGTLGPDRKLSNRLLIELDMDLQPTFHTIYCGGDRYRTHS